MLFNSIDFVVFLSIMFCLYWLLAGKRMLQNLLLIAGSYIFYGWWDWRFLLLIFFSSLVDFAVGLLLGRSKNPKHRKFFLSISLLVNLGFLGFFKYYNFFLDSFIDAFSVFGYSFTPERLNIILPVGISFYTFQTLSYSIDVYRREMKPVQDLSVFLAYVSFFPQLVAGPIERASHFLPQFEKRRVFAYHEAKDGLRQILWGFFKKVVIADNCAVLVNDIFANSSDYSSGTLLFGAFLFAFQIYGDFSGYSDIAIGTARLFGFQLMKNFAYPYFSRDIAEFWRRWHISLSSWFRDYLYIPLGGSRVDTIRKIRNIFIIFLVSGFWHGANWTFIVWGGLNALYFVPLMLSGKNRNHLGVVAENRDFPSIKEVIQMTMTFSLTIIAWVFFRANSVMEALDYLYQMCLPPYRFTLDVMDKKIALVTTLLIGFFLFIEWVGRKNEFALEHLGMPWPRFWRWSFYSFLIFLMGMYMQTNETPFIYFQF